MYEFGYGVQADDREAVKYYRRAAELGSAAAQHNLGTFYCAGRGGLRRDPNEAVRWYRLAAAQPGKMFDCGVSFYNG